MSSLSRLAGILVAALPLVFASNAAAVPDASCLPVQDTGSTVAKFAQTFTAQNTGQLISATLRTNKPAGTTQDYLLEIRSVGMAGVPTDTSLAAENLPASGQPDDSWADITANFSSPPSVVAGQQYAVALSRPGTTLFAAGKTADPCPGAAYSAAAATDPFVPVCPSTCSDWIFAVFVEPAVVPAPPQPGPTALPTATAPTGLRAAALKKCKKKRGKPRARCKRKANKLPL